MKAARSYGVKDVRIEEMEIRDPKENEVQIRVKYTGICGSDVHGYFRGWALPTVPHPITGKVLPVVLGHETSGEIVKTGAAAARFRPGDRVCVEPLLHCDTCEACRKGAYNCCENAVGPDGSGNIYGFGEDGGFAEYINVRETDVYQIPDTMDFELGALVEPAAVAVQAVQKSGLKVGQSVLIYGAGPIGLLVAITVMAAGATEVFLADVSEERLALAREIGVPHVLNAREKDVEKEVLGATGNGVDFAFDVAGVQQTFDMCADLIKNTGTVMVVAVFNEPPRVDFSKLLMKGGDILTTLCYANVYPETIRLINQNQERYRKVITKVIKLDDIVEEGFEFLEHDKSQAKVLVSAE